MIIVTAPLQTDDKGFVLQQCPFCEKYFKLKFGTGSNKPASYCPCCGRQGSSWHTGRQLNIFTTLP